MSVELLNSLVGYLVGGAVVYAAIRSDLAYLRARAEQGCKDAEKAHERIDSHIEVHHVRG